MDCGIWITTNPSPAKLAISAPVSRRLCVRLGRGKTLERRRGNRAQQIANLQRENPGKRDGSRQPVDRDQGLDAIDKLGVTGSSPVPPIE
jgi:hypothetical protein